MRSKISLALIGSLALLSSAVFTPTAHAYQQGTQYVWGPGSPNYAAGVNIYNGTINWNGVAVNNGRTANYVGYRTANGNGTWTWHNNPVSWGMSSSNGTTFGWDDNYHVGNVRDPINGGPNSNGDYADGYWVQVMQQGGWWDLGAAYDYLTVMPSQDHGPYLNEGLEFRVYGTNDPNSNTFAVASLRDIYLDGWRGHNAAEDCNRNGWQSDDITSVWSFASGAYRYVMILPWEMNGQYSEPEIDAVAGFCPPHPVPEPASMLLLGSGLIGLLSRRRKA